MDAREPVGIFGGTGFYRFLDGYEELAVDTPYGPPSARIRIGEIEGRRVAFMPRHGDEHTLPPHRINYRANLWAMKQVGVRRTNVPPVSADAAFEVFAENLDMLRALLFRAVPRIGPQPDDLCASALASAVVHH